MALVLCLGLTGLVQAEETTRGVGVASAQAKGDGLQTYGRSLAVVIGIDAYTHLGRLNGAVRDAKAVQKALEARGFQVKAFLNEDATRIRLEEYLRDELSEVARTDDRIVVYFAGHGISVKKRRGTFGYFMPVDAGGKRPTQGAISMQALQEMFEMYDARHVLYIADACHAGLAAQGTPSATLSDATKNDVRLVLTAGTTDQPVLDDYKGHGLFTYFLLQALAGKADADQDGYTTGKELDAYITPRVEKVAKDQFATAQRPQSSRFGQGDIVFKTLVQKDGGAARLTAKTRGADDTVSYFARTVWRNGTMHGVMPLTPTQAGQSETVFRIASRDGKVRRVDRLNGSGKLKPNDAGIAQWTHAYVDGVVAKWSKKTTAAAFKSGAITARGPPALILGTALDACLRALERWRAVAPSRKQAAKTFLVRATSTTKTALS